MLDEEDWLALPAHLRRLLFTATEPIEKKGGRLVIQKAVVPQWGRMMGTWKPKRYDDVLWKVVEELRDRNLAVLEVNRGW
jgi:uncharacterized lipoprotein YddW (UPF0748 family)